MGFCDTNVHSFLSLLSLANMPMLAQVGTAGKRELGRTRVWNSVKKGVGLMNDVSVA